MAFWKNSTPKAIIGGSLAIVAVSGVLSGAVALSGLPVFGMEPAAAAPEAPEAVVAQWKESPAMKTLTASLEKAPGGWKGRGELFSSAELPYPYSCTPEGPQPVVSLSRGFLVDGVKIQVNATAYTAGMGELAVDSVASVGRGCAGNAQFSQMEIGALGDTSYRSTVSKKGLSAQQILWNHGDVVVVVTTPTAANATDIAKKFQSHMAKNIGTQCASPNISADALNRTPWSSVKFTGLLQKEEVTIPAVRKPDIPTEAEFKAVSIPGPELEKKTLTLPTRPTGFPVWPELPEPKVEPVEPASPDADPPTKETIEILIEDKDGPGCGWAFTSTAKPDWDQQKVSADNDALRAATLQDLGRQAREWQEDVLEYWEAFHEYSEDLPEWNSYVEKVDKVAAAWAVIEEQWRAYNALKAQYDAAVVARDDFLARQKAAQDAYNTALEQCEAQGMPMAPEVAEEPVTEDPFAVDGEESVSVTPDTDEDSLGCPPVRPVILDQAAPSVPEKPTPPADPRPESERS